MMDTWTPEQLQPLLNHLFPQGQLYQTHLLKGGLSARLLRLDIGQQNEIAQSWVLRWPRQSTPAETTEYLGPLLNRLKNYGHPVPYCVFWDTQLRWLPVPFLLMEYISGYPRFGFHHPSQAISKTAIQLAKLHRTPFQLKDRIWCQQNLPSVPKPSFPLKAPKMRALQSQLETRWPPSPSAQATLLHGDFWPGNLLWNTTEGEQTLTGIIDWEDACWGDPLYDLAIARMEWHLIGGAEAKDTLTQTYLSHHDLNAESLIYWDAFAALRLGHMMENHFEDWQTLAAGYQQPELTAAQLKQHAAACLNSIYQALELD